MRPSIYASTYPSIIIFFETGSYYVAGLELTTQPKLASKLERSTCPCLLSAGIKCTYHHAWLCILQSFYPHTCVYPSKCLLTQSPYTYVPSIHLPAQCMLIRSLHMHAPVNLFIHSPYHSLGHSRHLPQGPHELNKGRVRAICLGCMAGVCKRQLCGEEALPAY